MNVNGHGWIQELPVLGAGVGFRRPFLSELFQNQSKVDFLEVTASLHQKRLNEASGYLPETRRILGPDFSRHFLRHAGTPPGPTVNRPLADALQFAGFVATEARRGAIAPEWIGDLARYEAARLRVFFGGRRLVIRRFRFRVDQTADGLAASPETAPDAPRKKSFLGIWWRLGRNGRPRHVVLAAV